MIKVKAANRIDWRLSLLPLASSQMASLLGAEKCNGCENRGRGPRSNRYEL